MSNLFPLYIRNNNIIDCEHSNEAQYNRMKSYPGKDSRMETVLKTIATKWY